MTPSVQETAAPATREIDLSAYRERFAALDRSSEPGDLAARRGEALDRFLETGFPTTREEEWRQTNVAPIARARFERGGSGAVDVDGKLFDGCDHMVFVDGRLRTGLAGVPEGTVVLPMAEALAQGDAVARQLGALVPVGQAFSDLNTALFEDGAYVRILEGRRMDRPLQIHFATSGAAEGDGASASFARNLIVVEKGAEAQIIETYAGPDGSSYLSSPVTEIEIGENAGLRHYKVMEEGNAAFHLAFQGARLERSARLHSIAVNHGGSIVRNDLRTLLCGEGISCTLNGLVLGKDRQLVDNHLWMEHQAPHCYSHQLYKGVLADRARTVFNGRIFVHREAQKTDAVQTNRNLLLSDDAIANSNPQLEIFADDVKCTHGSTIGQLEEEALFYLRSRGVDQKTARGLLVYAFASEVLQEIDLPALRDGLEQILVHELTDGTV